MQTYDEMVDSGVEWIGKIPSGWDINKFRGLYKVTNAGEVIPKEFWDPNGRYLLYTASQKPINSFFSEFPKSKLTTPNDILIARNGDGVIHDPEPESIYTNVVQRVILDLNFINKKYLIYALKASLVYVHGQSNGDFIVSLNMGIWNNTRIPVPPLYQQQKIADFLDAESAKIDNLIAKQERLLELLEEKRRATITHAVTRGLDPNVELKETGIPWLGKIPSQWNVVRVTRILAENKDNNSNLASLEPMKYGFGEIVHKSVDVNDESKDELRRYLLIRPQDIMINGLNLNYDFVTQRVAIVKNYGCITPAYISLRKRDDQVLPEFYNYLLKALDSQKVLNGWGTGIRLTLNYSELKKKELVKPPFNEQKQIVQYLDNYILHTDNLRKKIQIQISLLHERRTSLISHAVTGKIKI